MAAPLASQINVFRKYPLTKRAPSRCSKVYMVATMPTIVKQPASPVILKPLGFPHNTRSKGNHPLEQEKIEIFNSLESWASDNIIPHLKQVEKCWQPQDFLPDASTDDFIDKIEEMRERAKQLPDDYFVVLVGDMITEEALPTYQTFLNTKDGIRDETGSSLTPWAIWIRAWTAEENRHGDLLNKYLYLSGRVDMKQVEKSIQYLIGSGMLAGSNLSRFESGKFFNNTILDIVQDVHAENNPYLGFIYTSFQERATFISHGNTARLAKHHGDDNLAKICGTIASDEKRHEVAYTKIMEKLFEIDPDGSIKAFAYMMQKKIAMPAHWLYDGQDDNLFTHFSAVAQRLGVYTGKDYADIFEHLVEKWNVRNLVGLSSEGRKAQDYVCELGSRFRRLEERAHLKIKLKEEGPSVPFSWIFNKSVKL